MYNLRRKGDRKMNLVLPSIIHAIDYNIDVSEMKLYVKKKIPMAVIKVSDIASEGQQLEIETLEGTLNFISGKDVYIMIGVKGEIYPQKNKKFELEYKNCDTDIQLINSLNLSVTNVADGKKIDLAPYIKPYISIYERKIYAAPLQNEIEIYTAWDNQRAIKGKIGDYLACSANDKHDIYVIEKQIFSETYLEVI